MPENDTNPGDEKLLILPLGEESKKITQVISNDTARQIIELLADAPLSASDIADHLQVPLTTIVYNLENLGKVGLIKVEKIKYSEKGREVKIYAPVRKLIVVVPEKTDKKSVADLLRKYVGVILAAVLASSLIEFFMKRLSSNRVFEMANYKSIDSSSIESLLPNATSTPATMMNETAMSANEASGKMATTPVATPAPVIMGDSITPAATQPAPAAYAVNTSATPPPLATPSLPDSGAVNMPASPDILTNIANTITAHPGLLFLLGCLFVVIILVIMDYRRKRKV